MQERRCDFEFSNEDKRYVRQRASGTCEFPGIVCPNKFVRNVAHLTGASIAIHEGLDMTVISDPDLNALMLCKTHSEDLDDQEATLLTQIRADHDPIPFVSLETIREGMRKAQSVAFTQEPAIVI